MYYNVHVVCTPQQVAHVDVYTMLTKLLFWVYQQVHSPGADPGGVRWVRTNRLQYQLFLRAELIRISIAAGWPTRGATEGDGRRRAVSVIIDGRVQNT